MPASPKQKKQERLNQKFTDAILDELDLEESRTVLRILCNPRYEDPRPYIWSDLQSSPKFTYRLDLEGKSMDDLMSQFSKSMRYEMRKGEDLDLTVEQGGLDGAKRIHEDVLERFEEQGTESNLTWEYVRDLVTALDDRARVYVARGPDGDYLGGIMTLYSNDTVYYWQGGAAASYENVSVNSVLHHQILTDAVEDPPFDSIETYDLVGANTKRLCSYKAQFGGDLVRYYLAESDDATTKLAKRAYEWIGKASLKG
jgi:lipid II:glycine glycyltransferase (peptidoglycan interpeptide bridge formation enzyme)